MRVLSLVVLAGLVACASTSPEQIRKLEPEIGFTRASVDEVLRCFAGKGNGFISITPFPGSGAAEIEVKVTPLAKAKSLYLTTLTPEPFGAKISTQYSGTKHVAISESDYRGMLASCAPSG